MQIVRKWIPLFIWIFLPWQIAYADFLGAMTNYEKGAYGEAYAEFMRLAKVGKAEAQYNLGVMYYKGLHVEQDYAKAYAWIKVANGYDEKYSYADVQSILVDNEGVAEIEYSKLNDLYGKNIVDLMYKPTFTLKEITNNSTEYIGPLPIVKVAPHYPATAARKNINGYVLVGYTVKSNGIVSDVHVVEEYPKGAGFGTESIRAAKKFRYPVSEKKSANPAHDYYINAFKFEMVGWSSKQKNHSRKAIAVFIEKANNGNADAQYLLATAVTQLYKATIKQEKKNQLLLMSAENGYAKAQFRLGMKLLRGYGVEKDMDKGINWIREAAINGNEYAINFMDKYIENEK